MLPAPFDDPALLQTVVIAVYRGAVVEKSFFYIEAFRYIQIGLVVVFVGKDENICLLYTSDAADEL